MSPSSPPSSVVVLCDRGNLREEIAQELAGLRLDDVVVIAGCVGRGAERELVRRTAAASPLAAIVVVGGAADRGPVTAEAVLEAGAHQYLIEPLVEGQLALAVTAAARHSSALQVERGRLGGLRGRIETMVEQAPVPIAVKDRDGRYRIANAATHEHMGIEPGGMIGRRDVELLSAETAADAAVSDRSVLSGEGAFEGERRVNVGGRQKTYLSSKFPFADDRDRIVGVVSIAIDVTESRLNDAVRTAASLEQRRLIDALHRSRAETVDRLTMALHRRDACSGEHVSRMAVTAAWLADLLGFPRERVSLLRAAAPMHDVGKIAIRDDILQKRGELTREERDEMERHARIGFEMLDGSSSETLALGAEIALTHHENWDGSGYPRGLRGEEIPIEGRIAAVADVFDALLSDRPYREAMTADEARAIITDGSGKWFDPEVAAALLENWDDALALRNPICEPERAAASSRSDQV